MCCLLVNFYNFTIFLTIIKGIKYYLIKVTLYRTNSIIVPCSPFVILNVFDSIGVLF